MSLKVKAAIAIAALLLLLVMARPAQKVIANATEALRLSKLVREARESLARVRAELDMKGIKTFVGSTLRDEDEQTALVASGRSATNRSWHRVGRAVDLYPLLPSGKPDLGGKQIEKFAIMHQVAAKHGWRGIAFNADGSKRYIRTNKGMIWDGGHLEFRGGLTWEQAFAAYNEQRNVVT